MLRTRTGRLLGENRDISQILESAPLDTYGDDYEENYQEL